MKSKYRTHIGLGLAGALIAGSLTVLYPLKQHRGYIEPTYHISETQQAHLDMFEIVEKKYRDVILNEVANDRTVSIPPYLFDSVRFGWKTKCADNLFDTRQEDKTHIGKYLKEPIPSVREYETCVRDYYIGILRVGNNGTASRDKLEAIIKKINETFDKDFGRKK